MKVRTTIAAALRARLAVIGYGALTLLALVAISACTSGSSTPPVTLSASGSPTSTSTASPPATTTPTTTATATPTTTATATPTTTATATPTATPTPTPTVTRTVVRTPTPTPSYPSAAPVTGGGGTAGFQDGLLFALGAAAVVVGLGGIAYRRRLTRGR
jgi:carbohydrate-binding DOMON domain-containing protein